MRPKIGKVLAAVLIAVAGALVAPATAAASGNEFTAQARRQGLSVREVAALQAEVDAHLAEFGGKQVSPNQIDLGGTVLTLTLPGEIRPRRFDPPWIDECTDFADYGWFCAYEYQAGTGRQVGMYYCGVYPIPWSTVGSWENNQTTGTRPVLRFTATDGRPPWVMPAAYSATWFNVDWHPVLNITNC